MDITSYLLGKKASGGGGSGLDWSAIGYNETPQGIIDIYDYSKQIYDNWNNVSDLSYKFQDNSDLIIFPLVDTSNATSMLSMFYNCTSITSIPLLDTSKVEQMRFMFNGATSLKTIPQFNTSSLTRISSAFTGVNKLTDESLDNILKMCININPNYTRAKTLSELGLTSSYYPASRIQALPSYNDFIDAGWTIGY